VFSTQLSPPFGKQEEENSKYPSPVIGFGDSIFLQQASLEHVGRVVLMEEHKGLFPRLGPVPFEAKQSSQPETSTQLIPPLKQIGLNTRYPFPVSKLGFAKFWQQV